MIANDTFSITSTLDLSRKVGGEAIRKGFVDLMQCGFNTRQLSPAHKPIYGIYLQELWAAFLVKEGFS